MQNLSLLSVLIVLHTSKRDHDKACTHQSVIMIRNVCRAPSALWIQYQGLSCDCCSAVAPRYTISCCGITLHDSRMNFACSGSLSLHRKPDQLCVSRLVVLLSLIMIEASSALNFTFEECSAQVTPPRACLLQMQRRVQLCIPSWRETLTFAPRSCLFAVGRPANADPLSSLIGASLKKRSMPYELSHSALLFQCKRRQLADAIFSAQGALLMQRSSASSRYQATANSYVADCEL
eukprot:1563321-Amphidinium_carterae.2